MLSTTTPPFPESGPRIRPISLPGLIGAIALLAGTATANAQLFDDLDDTPQRPEPVPVAPTSPQTLEAPAPGLDGPSDWLAQVQGIEPERVSRLAEGTFLVRRPGTVTRVTSGHLVWLPDEVERRPGEGPMLLVPCQTLARLATSLADDPGRQMLVSGEVFVYHGNNYLLPTAFAKRPQGEAAPAPTGPDQSPDQPGDGLSDDPTIDELLDELDRSTAPRGLEAPSPDRGAGGRADARRGPSAPIEEGTYMTRRRARLVRGAGGVWTIAVDNDADSSDASDAPLTVVPCRLLMQMEQRAQRDGEHVTLIVSGRVYAYGARNYFVPALLQLPAKGGISARQ